MHAWENGGPQTAAPERNSDGAEPAGVRLVREAFRNALTSKPSAVRDESYKFAGRSVRLRVVGTGLGTRISRAFEHLRTLEGDTSPDLRIDLWDETETGVAGPAARVYDDLTRRWIACDGLVAASADGRYIGFLYQESGVILDRRHQHIFGYRRDGAHLSGGEYSKPLQLILSIWYQSIGVLPLHTALIAHQGAGVLIPGVSGTGKSTSSLASVIQGLEFLGDDFVALERTGKGGFEGHSMYSSVCLVKENLVRFPDLGRYAVEDAGRIEEKPILFLSDVFPERIRATVPIAALVLLRIGSKRTQVVPARKADALKELTASTLHTVVPRPGRQGLQMFGDLVERVPCYWLHLGPNMRTIAPSIRDIVQRASLLSAAERKNGSPDVISSSASRPRILVLSESLPWPTIKGGDLRNWQNISLLSETARVGVFGLCSNDSRQMTKPGLPLEFWSTSSDEALKSPPPTGVKLAARAWLLHPSGHPSDLFYSEKAEAELKRCLESYRPDIAITEGLWMHRYLDVLRRAGCKIILDCHNVEAAVFRNLADAQDTSDLVGRVIRQVIPARTEAIERAALEEVDQVWVCSDADERTLRRLYAPRVPIEIIPNGIQTQDYDAVCASRRDAKLEGSIKIVYTGIYSYLPNARAASYLINEVLPRLDSVSDVPVSIVFVGPTPTDEMLQAALRDPRVVITGPVYDVRPYLATATVMAVPLFQGSGTRFKVLEAFASNLPVVSTAKGVEGLKTEHGVQILAAETPEEFAYGIFRLSGDSALSNRLANNARSLVREQFSWEAVAPRIRRSVGRLHAGAGQ